MSQKQRVILPIASAIASLASVPAIVDEAAAKISDRSDASSSQNAAIARTGQPNVVFKAGEDLLGLIVKEQADGTVVVDHYSHSSHASHASHHSHYSSIV
jgi:hypothetical protein